MIKVTYVEVDPEFPPIQILGERCRFNHEMLNPETMMSKVAGDLAKEMPHGTTVRDVFHPFKVPMVCVCGAAL